MYRHLVLFRLDPSATDEQREEAVAALEAMEAGIPQIRQLSVGRNAGDNLANYDLVIHVDFDGAEDFGSYLAAPAHVNAWTKVVQPITKDVAMMQWDEAD